MPDNHNINRRKFISVGATLGLGIPLLGKANSSDAMAPKRRKNVKLEWRNKQAGMAYRQLGDTGMMISEIVNGGDPVRFNNLRATEIAMERGLNYLDMASGYGNGECEESYGRILDSNAKREKVFLTTKVSGFANVRNNLYREIYDGLPSGKQEHYQKKAKEMREARKVDKPGYFFTYWPGQPDSFDGTYLSNAMASDYAHKVDGSPKFKEFILNSIEGSLRRVGTDYFDILMCPHGAGSSEEVEIEDTFTTFEQLKKDGKVRFLGVSTHNDPAGVLRAARETGQYEVAMVAYNVLNGGYMEREIELASESGMGIIAMKAAMAVATHHEALQPIPEWRIQKVDRIVPGNMKPALKAYLWALQNPNISAVISNLWDEQYVNENLSIAGKKVELQPG
ncbi:aldo/keto reductase [Pleomorphovibrio marinus]|uniref:aldo/keto reductase n=1 Tax=Pleomorphovibrio marinus TaxID=2164132 RepID=UPI000E0BC198|nr:aldo/keto reductase [Pleomorphovibrio marinus]